jgi:ADP-ribosylglycohydrolase
MTTQQRPIQLNRREYRNKVRGCWLGKNIGGTLGGPYEGHKYVNGLTYYNPVPAEPQPNDDLDLQLVWLRMLEDTGARWPHLSDFVRYWLDYLSAYPDSEYGVCLMNLERGLRPPISGCFENGFVDCMGSPIRSEIWACIAPGDPQLAASLAYLDAQLDHAGGEGVYGEMFWSAVQSAAFVETDTRTLIRIGLSMIPLTSYISRAIREVLWGYDHNYNWTQNRSHIAEEYSNPVGGRGQGYSHPSIAAPNHAFTVIGWLYGKDFEDRLLTAVNCGYDTDCTGATLAALLGIIEGADALPARWVKPVGDKIILYERTRRFNHPKTVDELTRRTEAVAEKFVATQSDTVCLSGKTILPNNLPDLLWRNERARNALAQYDLQSAVETDKDLEIIFHYDREPVLYPNTETVVRVSVRWEGKPVDGAEVKLAGPKSWKIDEKGPGVFGVRAKTVSANGRLTVKVRHAGRKYTAGFVLLSPDKITGFQWGVERCRVCHARKGACLCRKPK